MKLLLTSSGLENETIINALRELVVKPFSELKVAFIPTASNLETGDKSWLLNDLNQLQELQFSSIDIVDISALPKIIWLHRLEAADILFVEGGDTYHLMYWLNQSGLSEILPKLLETRTYVGVSAGTMVVTPSLLNAEDDKQTVVELNEVVYDQGLSLVNFMIEPHLNNHYFPDSTFEILEKKSLKYNYPIYCLDDNSAIKVDDGKIEVISEGNWKKFG